MTSLLDRLHRVNFDEYLDLRSFRAQVSFTDLLVSELLPALIILHEPQSGEGRGEVQSDSEVRPGRSFGPYGGRRPQVLWD